MMTSAQNEIEKLEQAINSLEQQRQLLGDLAVNTAIAGLRQKLEELRTQSEPEQRKLLTILFGDVSGFTSLSETHDAEEVSDAMKKLWETIDEIILNFGGKIDKHMGDAVMALWGASGVREDDAERAIRAAFEIQRSLSQAAMQGQKLPALQMRIGINTGMALLTQVGVNRQELSAIGDAVNVASRLQTAAPVGGVLISHESYRQVRGLFDVTAVPPLSVKGRSEPVQAYLVTRPKPRSFRMATRGVEGVETRMVGRESEFGQLKRLYDRSRDMSRAQLACICGDAGLGKSRLLHEFDVWFEVLPEPVYYFKGRCTMEMTNQPYSLFHDLFRFRFQIQDSDGPKQVREKIAAQTQLYLTPEQAHLMGQLIGFDQEDLPTTQHLADDPANLAVLAQEYLLDYLHGMTDVNGMLIYFEDLHWADNASLDLILRILQNLAEKRLMIICTTRPTIFERKPGWGNAFDSFHTIQLKPLPPEDSIALVQEILQKVDYLPDSLCQLIASNAEGNPFYVEELIKMLIEEGGIICGSERWYIKQERIQAIHVPSTLTELLQARLDSLPYEEKKILQRAAIIGRLFWDSAVQALRTEGGAEPNVPSVLQALLRREFIFHREHSKFAGAEEYIFKHSILRDVTYETVLLKMRRMYHHQAARWFETAGEQRLNEYSGVIADHYERAGENPQAVEWLTRAGEVAAQANAYPEAIAFFERALHLTSEQKTAAQADLLIRLGECYERNSDYPLAIRYLQEGLEIAREIKHQKGAARAQASLGLVNARQGNYDEALERVTQSLKLARLLNAPDLIAEGLQLLANVWYYQANYDTAASYYQQSLILFRQLNNQRGVVRCMAGLGLVLIDKGDYPQAQNVYSECLALSRANNDRRGMTRSLIYLGLAAYFQKDYPAARQHYEESLEILRRLGDRQGMFICLTNLGNVALAENQTDQAAAYTEESIRLCREIGDRANEANCLNNLGHIHLRRGEEPQARCYYLESLRKSKEINAAWMMLESLAGLSGLLAREGETLQAARLVGLTLHHPATNGDISTAAEPALQTLQAALPEAELQSAMQAGAQLDLDQCVAELLK